MRKLKYTFSSVIICRVRRGYLWSRVVYSGRCIFGVLLFLCKIFGCSRKIWKDITAEKREKKLINSMLNDRRKASLVLLKGLWRGDYCWSTKEICVRIYIHYVSSDCRMRWTWEMELVRDASLELQTGESGNTRQSWVELSPVMWVLWCEVTPSYLQGVWCNPPPQDQDQSVSVCLFMTSHKSRIALSAARQDWCTDSCTGYTREKVKSQYL